MLRFCSLCLLLPTCGGKKKSAMFTFVEVFLALPSRMHNEMNRDNETIYLL
jgi:hypothetical protein